MTSPSTDRRFGQGASIAQKAPCRLATTANITLSGSQTIDGIATSTDDRILVKDQTDSTENGIYLADTGDWTRTTDFDGQYDATGGTLVLVNQGSVNSKTGWMVSANGAIVIGTDDVVFTAVVPPGSWSSSALSFTQAVIGTLVPVARTMQAKGREVITTADFTGTVPPGLTGVGTGVLASVLTTSLGDLTAVGTSALAACTVGFGHTAIGFNALKSVIGTPSGNNCTAIGYRSQTANTLGDNNTSLGYNSLAAGTGANFQENTAIGVNSGLVITSGQRHTAVGAYTLQAVTTVDSLTAIGTWALSANTSGTFNTAVGFQALRYPTTATLNTAVGYNALAASGLNSSSNTGVGANALIALTTGTGHVAIGANTLTTITTADTCTAVGNVALTTATGAKNTALGQNAGSSVTTGSNLTLLGYNAQASSATATNEVTLGDTNVTALRAPGASTGLTATFGVGNASGSVTAVLDGGSDSGTGSAMQFKRATVNKAAIGTRSAVTGGASSGLDIYSFSDDIILYTAATAAVTITTAQVVKFNGYTGAATRQAGDVYLVVDASGNIHKSAIGPAS